MVRRIDKKEKLRQKAGVKVSLPVESARPAEAAGGSGTTWKILAVIAVVLAFLYGPSLFQKNAVFQPPSKFFLVREVAQFTGDDIQGSPFFANDIVAVGPHEFALTDNLGAQVLLCDFKGKLIRKWGKNGSGAKEFREPSGIATDGKGRLFVLDTINGALKFFDLDGTSRGSINLSQYGAFSTPRRLGWGGNNILVTNAADARLYRLSLKGQLLAPWGEKGAGKGGLWGASKALVDSKGRYYMGESNAKDSRVRVYDPTGTVVQEIKTGVSADSLGLDSLGRLFVVSYGDNAKVFDQGGNWLGCLADEARPTAPLNQIAGIDILPDGLILTCGGNVITLYQLIDEKGKRP